MDLTPILLVVAAAGFIVACAGWLVTHRKYRALKTEYEDIEIEYDATKLAEMLNSGPHTLDELIEKSGMPKAAVELFLREAKKKGLVEVK